MAAAASDIGATASRYTGDAGLGGGSFGAVKLDLRPIEDLARYTFLYNKSEYDQRQKDAEAAAKEIADMTSYDLTSSIPKDAKLLQQGHDELTSYADKHPDALNYRNRKEWTAYKKMRNKLENDLQGGKVRNTMNMMRQKAIDDEPNVAEKARRQKALDDEIARTDIRTPLQHDDKYDIEPVQYKAPGKLKFTISKEYPNYLSSSEVLTTDMSDVNQQANTIEMGLSKFTNPQTPQEQEQFQAQVNTGKLEPIMSAEYISKTMPSFMKDGVFDVEAAKKSGIAIISGNIANAEIYNQRMRDMISAIDKRAFEDKLSGGVAAFGVNGLNKKDYAEIDLNKGYITPSELIKMRLLGLSDNIQSKAELKPTDNQIHKLQIGETARHNRAQEAIGWQNLKDDRDKWKASMGGGETVKNGAMLRAQRIYDDMLKLADKNGVISPDKLRQLNAEQLKYLGVETVVQNEAGTSIPKSIYQPLEFGSDKEGDKDKGKEFAIQLINGEIKVMRPKGDETKLKRTASGGYEGMWDNSRSTNLFNTATNILNEELQKAGAKELNSYMPIDLGRGGVSVNTTGGGTATSSSSVSKESYKSDENPSNWKNNGNGTYIYIPTGQKIDAKTGKVIQ